MTSADPATFDVEALLADPASLPAGLDAAEANMIASGALTAVVNDLTADRWTACGDLLSALAQTHPTDTVYACARSWSQHRPNGANPSHAAIAGLKDMAMAHLANLPPASLTVSDPAVVEEIKRLVV